MDNENIVEKEKPKEQETSGSVFKEIMAHLCGIAIRFFGCICILSGITVMIGFVWSIITDFRKFGWLISGGLSNVAEHVEKLVLPKYFSLAVLIMLVSGAFLWILNKVDEKISKR